VVVLKTALCRPQARGRQCAAISQAFNFVCPWISFLRGN